MAGIPSIPKINRFLNQNGLGQGGGLDSDALAYALTTGLTGDPLLRLSNFMSETKNSGVDLKLTTLGRSEFLARSGVTHRSVIGPNATITGTVGNTTTGMDFNASSANHMELDNPAPFTSGRIWQLIIVAPDALATSVDLMSGANGNTGPVVRIATNGQTSYRGTEGPAGTVVFSRASTYTNYSAGTWMMYGGQIGMGHIQPLIGIFAPKESTTSIQIWNNETKWRIGEGLNGFNRLDGKVSLVMAGLGELTYEQIYKIAASAIRYEIATLAPPQWIGFVGDSMTVSTAGGAGVNETRQCIWVQSNSGWKGSLWDMEALGGTPIAGQETFFETMMTRMSYAPDMPRTIVFWGGFNTPPETWLTQSLWEALADRYVAMATTAAAAGISTVHWSRPVDNSAAAAGSDYYDGVFAFNDYYRDQLALLDGNHIFYDHRDTFSAGEFDGNTANPAYYGSGGTDPVHLSAAGISAMMVDFLSQYPNPS